MMPSVALPGGGAVSRPFIFGVVLILLFLSARTVRRWCFRSAVQLACCGLGELMRGPARRRTWRTRSASWRRRRSAAARSAARRPKTTTLSAKRRACIRKAAAHARADARCRTADHAGRVAGQRAARGATLRQSNPTRQRSAPARRYPADASRPAVQEVNRRLRLEVLALRRAVRLAGGVLPMENETLIGACRSRLLCSGRRYRARSGMCSCCARRGDAHRSPNQAFLLLRWGWMSWRPMQRRRAQPRRRAWPPRTFRLRLEGRCRPELARLLRRKPQSAHHRCRCAL